MTATAYEPNTTNYTLNLVSVFPIIISRKHSRKLLGIIRTHKMKLYHLISHHEGLNALSTLLKPGG